MLAWRGWATVHSGRRLREFPVGGWSKLKLVEELSLGILVVAAIVAFAFATHLVEIRRSAVRVRRADVTPVCRRDHGLDLERSLDAAVRANSYRVDRKSAPGVRLESAVRVTPGEFAVAAPEIAGILQAGRVASVDLSRMEMHEAARLVDYCRGLTVMANGWIYQLARSVIVITPES
ncbi:cell division protein SepF [Micromonospora sp. WMMC250]|uniref:cell division protein SepF n=1 Tax=Micromonospora sp. WMMC250 TaxID=3014781 RepID=UPI003FA5FF5D